MDYSKILEDLTDQDSFWDDLYRVLGCAPSNTREQITAEYKRRVLIHHPDKRTNGQTSNEEFVRLTEAYKILGDNEQRKQYDRWRTSGLKLSYTKWCQLGEQAQAIHWHSVKETPVIELNSWSALGSQSIGDSPVAQSSDDLYALFRNYRI